MVDYDPLIPAANDLISDSQADIQNNFSELNTLYDVDHQKWNAGTAAYRGKHKKMTFPEAYTSGTAPALGSDLGILFPQIDPKESASPRPQMYWKNQQGGGTTFQVTNRFYNATTGYYMLPFGTAANPSLIFMWGIVAASLFTNAAGASFFDVTLPSMSNYAYTGPQTAGFPNNLLNVQLTTSYDDGTNKVVHLDNSGLPPTKESFRILMTVNKTDFDFVHWFAIGN